MRNAIALLFLMVFFSLEPAHAEDIQTSPNQTGSITVQLTGVENDQGPVKLCVCRSEDEYTGKTKEFCTASTELKSKKAEWVFKNMPYGTYSIKAFHDENENSKLDTNFAGMPVELYGFSNNARGQFGPPSFAKTAFTLSAPQMTVAIELK
jgi:uncharacterized protein (DUF2141 family)